MTRRKKTVGLFVLFMLFIVVAAWIVWQQKRLREHLPTAIQLSFHQEVVFPNMQGFDGAPLGGFSGVDFNAENSTLAVVSDDWGVRAPTRLTLFRLELKKKDLWSLSPEKQVFLKRHDSAGGAKGSEKRLVAEKLDAEGIRFWRGGGYLISSEGILVSTEKPVSDKDKQQVVGPSLRIYDASGVFQRELSLPDRLQWFPDAHDLGQRKNRGFESLAIANQGRTVYTIPEWALYQDGEPSSPQKKSFLRLVELDLSETHPPVVSSRQEFVYPLSPVPSVGEKPLSKGEISVSDFLSLGERRFLVIEKSYLPEINQNHVALFFVDCGEGTDVSSIASLTSSTYHSCGKRLVLDLEEIRSQLENPQHRIDNIEGISLGPVLSNGDRTLILVSDDNFNQYDSGQITQFIFLRWDQTSFDHYWRN